MYAPGTSITFPQLLLKTVQFIFCRAVYVVQSQQYVEVVDGPVTSDQRLFAIRFAMRAL